MAILLFVMIRVIIMSDFNEPSDRVECPECGCKVPEFKIEVCCGREMCDECEEEHAIAFHPED